MATAALGVAAAGCVSSSVADLPPPPTTLAPLTTTTAPVTHPVTLDPVPGTTVAAKVALGPGSATLSGTVTGPAAPAAPPASGSAPPAAGPPSGGLGPIGGATVEIERFVGNAEVAAEVSAGANGSWVLPHVLGGRYRVRAWRAPNLAQVQPDILFVNDGQDQRVDLHVNLYSGYAVASSLQMPVVGQPALLGVEITNQAVDAMGVVRAVPLAGSRVNLVASAGWRVTTPNPATTNGSGQAGWGLVCLVTGVQALSVMPDGATTLPLAIPACVGSPPPTTTPTTSTAPATATSTTSPGAGKTKPGPSPT